MGRSPWNFPWMSMDGQGTKWRRNIAKNFNRLSRAHERYRQTTDGRATAYSERQRESRSLKKPSEIQPWLLLNVNRQSYRLSVICRGRRNGRNGHPRGRKHMISFPCHPGHVVVQQVCLLPRYHVAASSSVATKNVWWLRGKPPKLWYLPTGPQRP